MRQRNARLRLEALEGRYAPSVTTSIMNGVLTVSSDNAGNTIAIDHNTATATTTVNGQSFADSLFTSIRINGGLGNDTDNLLATPAKPATVTNAADATVNVGKAGSVQGILGPLNIENPRGSNRITVEDAGDPVAYTVTLDTVTPTGDSAFGRLLGLAPAPIEYEYADTGAITVETSRARDTVNVLTTGVQTTLIGEFAETVNVGNNGSVAGIGGLLRVENGPSVTALNVDNSTGTARGPVTLGASNSVFGVGFIDGLAPQRIEYNSSDVSAVTVDGGATVLYTVTNTVTNLFNPVTTLIVGTAVLPSGIVQATSGPLTVFGIEPDEFWTVGVAGSVQGVHGPLSFQTGQHSGITLDDSADPAGRNVTINDDNIAGLAPAAISYQGVGTRVTLRGGSAVNSVNTFTINGNSGSASSSTELDLGSGTSAVNVRATTAPVSIFGVHGAVDTVIGSLAPGLGGTVANIRGPVSTTQLGTLTVDDAGDFTARNVAVGGIDSNITGLAPAAIGFNTTPQVTINGGSGGNTFTVTGSSFSRSLTLNTGLGADTVNVQSTAGSLAINGQSGVDTVNLGNTSNGTASIQGSVTVTNANGHTALNVNDQANPALSTSVVLFRTGPFGGFAGPGPFDLFYAPSDLGSTLTINGASRFNAINFFNVQATAPGWQVQLNTDGQINEVNVGDTANTLDEIPGPLTVTYPNGFNTLNINDQGETTAHFYTVTFDSVVRSPGGPGIFHFGSVFVNVHPGRQLGAGPTGSVVDVQGIAADTSVEVDAGGGATVNVGNDAGTLDDLHGLLSVVGNDGTVTLNVNDQGSADPQDYAIGDSTVDRSGAAEITYSGVGALALNAGTGGNQIDVQGLPFGTPAVVNAGPGGDLVRMRGGPVNAPLTLRGRGNTALGYVAYTTPVVVDVPGGQATDVKGGFSGIRRITGGQDLNILVGDGTQDLSGAPGSRNLLISGGGSGTLTGGGVGDILIGAATAYDADAHGELEAILAEWTSGAYADVVPHILAGDTALDPYPLNASTVFDNGAQNTLIGHPQGGELSLYYVTDAEAGRYDATADETVINVSGGSAPQVGGTARLPAPVAATLPATAPDAGFQGATALGQSDASASPPRVPDVRAAAPIRPSAGNPSPGQPLLGTDLDGSDAWQPLGPGDGALI